MEDAANRVMTWAVHGDAAGSGMVGAHANSPRRDPCSTIVAAKKVVVGGERGASGSGRTLAKGKSINATVRADSAASLARVGRRPMPTG